ncbi:hypothetical protein DUI87_04035 [Hirundo rustica rustica]|uniref:Uncharacterized protein n=1 Tax=Hirundo rustica rustica TaxID=333673 RepID=A0A3M0L640_HIRRU|nr:hypothetical protein DUI87_04035 [Hirundo rustica rustica]
MGRKAVPLHPVHRVHREQIDLPEDAATPWQKPMKSWQVLWPFEVYGGPTLEQAIPEGLHSMEWTHMGTVQKVLQPVGRTQVGEVPGGLPCLPWEGSPAGVGEREERSNEKMVKN